MIPGDEREGLVDLAKSEAAAPQFVRKVSGSTAPSKANVAAFDQAVHDIAANVRTLLASLVTTAPPRNRETEAGKAQERSMARFPRGHSRPGGTI